MKVDDIRNTVICADCLDIMKQLPDKCIDLVLTDPPYGIGENNGQYKSRNKNRIDKRSGRPIIINHPGYKKSEWDSKIPDKKYFDEIFRISKNQVIFGGNYFIEYLKNTSCFIVWDKCNGESDFADCELAWTSFRTAVRKIEYMWSGFCQGKSITEGRINQGNKKKCEKRIHPTQKPVALFGWILQNYSTPSMTVFDPFAGSGTTAIACLETGRDYILVEKEPDYVEIINKRIATWKEQWRLFA